MSRKLVLASLLVTAVVSGFAFKIDYRTVTGTPVHETITKLALDDIVVYFPSGKLGKIKGYFADYLAEENTENDENGINEGILHFDGSQMVDSARHTYLAVQNAILAFKSGDYVTSDASYEITSNASYGITSISTSYESAVQANLGSAMHTVQDFFAHSTWVETNKFFGAFNASDVLSDWVGRQQLPMPRIGMLEYPFNETGFLAQDGITLLDDKKGTVDGDDIAGGCDNAGYHASVKQLSSAYYDFKMSALPGYSETNLGASTTGWNGQCVAADATLGRYTCSKVISWPMGRCIHGDHLAGINKDDESRPLHALAFNSARQATRELMLYFLSATEAVTDLNESAACKLIFECTSGEAKLNIEAPTLVQNPYNRPSSDSRSVYSFKINRPMNYLLEVTFNGRACQLLEEALTVTDAPEKFFACNARYSETGSLKIYQKANPSYVLYQAENFVANPPSPTVSLTATPASISQGASAVLQWTSANTTSCTASGAWSGAQGTSGSVPVAPSTVGSHGYSLTCTGLGGTANTTASVAVTAVSPTPAPTVSFTSSPASITAGASATLQWSATNATACTASGAWSGDRATSGTLSMTPSTAGSYVYTLACTGAGGTTFAAANLTVAASVTAPAVTFSSSPANIIVGASATLQWYSTNATACTASGAWSGVRATSGTLPVTPSASGSYAYTLACTGAGGTTFATANLTIATSVPGSLNDDFNSTTSTVLDPMKWTSSPYRPGFGDPTVGNGLVHLANCQSANTAGKVTVSGGRIVIEARFVGPKSSGRDTYIKLVDPITDSFLQIGDSNYWSGIYLQHSVRGTYDSIKSYGGTSTNQFQEYRITLDGKTVTIERGDTLATFSKRIVETIPSSVTDGSYYIQIGTGGCDGIYSPADFDWIRVSAY